MERARERLGRTVFVYSAFVSASLFAQQAVRNQGSMPDTNLHPSTPKPKALELQTQRDRDATGSPETMSLSTSNRRASLVMSEELGAMLAKHRQAWYAQKLSNLYGTVDPLWERLCITVDMARMHSVGDTAELSISSTMQNNVSSRVVAFVTAAAVSCKSRLSSLPGRMQKPKLQFSVAVHITLSRIRRAKLQSGVLGLEWLQSQDK